MTARRRLAFVLYRASLWLLGRDPSCCVTVYSDRFAEFPRLARFVRDLEAMPFQPDDLGGVGVLPGRDQHQTGGGDGP